MGPRRGTKRPRRRRSALPGRGELVRTIGAQRDTGRRDNDSARGPSRETGAPPDAGKDWRSPDRTTRRPICLTSRGRGGACPEPTPWPGRKSVSTTDALSSPRISDPIHDVRQETRNLGRVIGSLGERAVSRPTKGDLQHRPGRPNTISCLGLRQSFNSPGRRPKSGDFGVVLHNDPSRATVSSRKSRANGTRAVPSRRPQARRECAWGKSFHHAFAASKTKGLRTTHWAHILLALFTSGWKSWYDRSQFSLPGAGAPGAIRVHTRQGGRNTALDSRKNLHVPSHRMPTAS